MILILKNYRWRFNPNFRILFCERRLALNHHLQFILAAARPMAAGNSFFNNDTRTVPPCPRLVHTRAIIPFPQQNTAAPCAYFPPHGGVLRCYKIILKRMSHFPGFHRLFYRGPEHRAPFPGTGSRESFQKQVSPMPPGAGRANMERGGDAYDCAKKSVPVNNEPASPVTKVTPFAGTCLL